jgi:hypothetical protein
VDIKNGLEDRLFNSEMTMLIAQDAVKKKMGRRDMPGLKNGQDDSLFNREMTMVIAQDAVKKMVGRREMPYGQIHSKKVYFGTRKWIRQIPQSHGNKKGNL